MYTTGAAGATFAEGGRGIIASGRLADLVLLSGDPDAGSAEDVLTLRPELTVVGGRVVWRAGAETGGR